MQFPSCSSKLTHVRVKSLSSIDKQADPSTHKVHPLHTVFLSYRRVHSRGAMDLPPHFLLIEGEWYEQ
jgi:hypothetical protein